MMRSRLVRSYPEVAQKVWDLRRYMGISPLSRTAYRGCATASIFLALLIYQPYLRVLIFTITALPLVVDGAAGFACSFATRGGLGHAVGGHNHAVGTARAVWWEEDTVFWSPSSSLLILVDG